MIASTTTLLIGLNFTAAINASVINAIQPVSTVLLAMLVLHDRLRLSQVFGVVLGLMGRDSHDHEDGSGGAAPPAVQRG